MVGDDVASVDGVGGVELPGEMDADGVKDGLHLLEVFELLIFAEIIGGGDQMDVDFLVDVFLFHDGFEQFHEVAGLVEQADVGGYCEVSYCP